MNAKILITTMYTLVAVINLNAQQEASDSLTRELQEIIVTAKQPATRLVGTTLVSTIAGSNLADLGNALDVLAQLPMINVQDNAVNVIGRSNIEIYINGRPMRDKQELQQILSSDLKKVELIMAPGACYESTTGAVLKITTKRNLAHGLSLSDQFKLQRRRKWSVMDDLSLSYRTDNWEFFLNGTISHNNSLAKGFTTNTFMYGGKETVVGGSQYNKFSSTTGILKSGFSYTKDSHSFGAYYQYTPEHEDFNNNGSEWIDNSSPIIRNIDKRTHGNSHLVSAYYENTFGGKYRLHFDGDFRQSAAGNNVATSYIDATNPDVSSTDRHRSTLWAGKMYLSFPLCDGDFTVGTQDSHTQTSLDYHMLNSLVEEYIPSSLTEARQTSAAIFTSWAKMFGNISVSIGARYEYVDYDFKTNGIRDKDISRNDHLLTPDLSLGYSSDNGDSQISLSYKMATVRPPYSQLTSSLSYVGLHEIEGGNPALKDEKMHDIQLFGMLAGFMLQADYIHSHNTYAFVKQLYPADNLQLLMHPVNIDVSAISLYLVWSKPVRRWTPNLTAGMYRQWLDIGSTHYNKPIFSYYFDNTFSLPHGWLITANISGQTRGDMHTNRFGSTLLTMNASAGKTFLDKALTVKLSATDIFNTANNNWTMNTHGVSVDKRQSYDRRGISLNIIYNFQPQKSKYKGASAAEAELKRL